jgi:signal transduction histidine kinase
LRIFTTREAGLVRIWVEDNGIGIAPEHHERIFGLFHRLPDAQKYPGTGVGLALVRKGAERMNGRAGVESTPGTGSRFWIELSEKPPTPDAT